jgi:hypothetical protein
VHVAAHVTVDLQLIGRNDGDAVAENGEVGADYRGATWRRRRFLERSGRNTRRRRGSTQRSGAGLGLERERVVLGVGIEHEVTSCAP